MRFLILVYLANDGRGVFNATYQIIKENEFHPLNKYFIWDEILWITLLQPAICQLEEILTEIESCINSFRENKDFINLENALYTVSNIHLALFEKDSAHIEQALAALSEAEELKKISSKADNILIERQLYTHARAHRMAGQDDEADRYQKQAYEWLMACADKITTPEYRQSYLEDVPENVGIQVAY